MPNPVKVVFIGASPRSGSTLLDRILGSLPGFHTTGELRRIWDRGLVRNQPCGCGSSFRQCPFWTEVLGTAFPSFREADLNQILGAKKYVESMRSLFRIMLGLERRGRYGMQFNIYEKAMTYLYRAIADTCGKNIIVDSSKMPMHGFLLNRMEELDLYFIHLVRDSRAVSHSLQRRKELFRITGKSEWMATKKPFASALDWDLLNGLLALLGTTSVRRLVIRYEDLVTETERSVKNILAWLGEPVALFSGSQPQTIQLSINHTVSGNPMRFQTGEIEVRPDLEWHSSNKGQHRLITALTWPFLWMYGYQLKSRSSEPNVV